MRRFRVTASMRKQLADVRAMKHSARRGGVMRVPAILGVNEWEAIAAVQQDKLIAASWEDREDRAKVHPEPVMGADPADVTDRYKPSNHIA